MDDQKHDSRSPSHSENHSNLTSLFGKSFVSLKQKQSSEESTGNNNHLYSEHNFEHDHGHQDKVLNKFYKQEQIGEGLCSKFADKFTRITY